MVNIITRAMLDQLRAQLQRGASLGVGQQRALVEGMIRQMEQSDANVDRLVRARETYDRLCKSQADGSIPKPLLVLLIELGQHLGHEGG